MSEKKWETITHGKDFWCRTTNKTQLVKLLWQYLKDENITASSNDNADTHIGGPASDFACEKNVIVFAEDTCIFILFCTY